MVKYYLLLVSNQVKGVYDVKKLFMLDCKTIFSIDTRDYQYMYTLCSKRLKVIKSNLRLCTPPVGSHPL